MNQYMCKAKNLDGEWVYGYYVFQRKRSGAFGQQLTTLDHDRHLICFPNGSSHEINPNTLCRCTGVGDIDGNMIFEHDIVEHSCYGCIVTNEVKWINGVFYLGTHSISYFFSMRIQGNKFDNTELMHGGTTK